MALEREGTKDFHLMLSAAIHEYRTLAADEVTLPRSEEDMQEARQKRAALNKRFADLCERADGRKDLLKDYPLVAQRNPGATATLYSFRSSVFSIMKITRPNETDAYFPAEEPQRRELLEVFENRYRKQGF